MTSKTVSNRGGRPKSGNRQSPEPETIGFRLRLSRESAGKTVLEVAKEMGKSDETVRSYELNKQSPDARYLEKYCVSYGFSADYLVLGRGELRHQAPGGPRPFNADLMRLAMAFAELAADRKAIPGGRSKEDYATDLYEFLSGTA